MGGDEVIALVAVIGVLIAVFLTIGLILPRFISYKERQLGLMADKTAEKAAQYASHVEQLEARVRVLERIATDKGADLAQQIEDLRVAPVAAAQFDTEERA